MLNRVFLEISGQELFPRICCSTLAPSPLSRIRTPRSDRNRVQNQRALPYLPNSASFEADTRVLGQIRSDVCPLLGHRSLTGQRLGLLRTKRRFCVRGYLPTSASLEAESRDVGSLALPTQARPRSILRASRVLCGVWHHFGMSSRFFIAKM